jgi:hypothetical protein
MTKKKAKSTAVPYAVPYKIASIELAPLNGIQKLGTKFKNRLQKLPGYQKLPGLDG